MAKEMSTGATVSLGKRMIRKGNSFEGALGACLVYGTYRDRRKIISSFELVIEKFKYDGANS